METIVYLIAFDGKTIVNKDMRYHLMTKWKERTSQLD